MVKKKSQKSIDSFIKIYYNQLLLFLYLSPAVFDYSSPKSHPDGYSASKVKFGSSKKIFSACK